MENMYKLIPGVDEILENRDIKSLSLEISRKVILDSIRQELEILRDKIKKDILNIEELDREISLLVENIIRRSKHKSAYMLKRVVNATGVVIHTNLGRSPINDKIIDNIRDVATNYSNLEYDLETGKRGLRYDHLEDILREITGCQAAMVVNNNAAAILLVLSSLSRDKEAIVSRGELIEIGGSFRIPDVMEQSGARLVSVGTTNKTHLKDYELAINENTGVLLKVHTSNYRILGFTSSVDSGELIGLKEKYNIPLVEDLGSGSLVDLSQYGIEYEPTVQESLAKGVDIVTFSGDKLLGGPQAGIIVGKKKYIDEMKKHPLTRAFRVDKFTIAALEAVLSYYRDEKHASQEIPTLNMLTKEEKDLEKDAKELLNIISQSNSDENLNIDIEDSYSEVGGGSLPLERLKTKCLVLSSARYSSQSLERELRHNKIPIISRLYKDKIYLDLRTIKKEEYEIIGQGIIDGLKRLKEKNI